MQLYSQLRAAMTDNDKTTFFRHLVHRFDFTALGGKKKWTAYKFTKSIYDKFMPAHHKLVCSAINDIPPGLDFEVTSVATSAILYLRKLPLLKGECCRQ